MIRQCAAHHVGRYYSCCIWLFSVVSIILQVLLPFASLQGRGTVLMVRYARKPLFAPHVLASAPSPVAWTQKLTLPEAFLSPGVSIITFSLQTFLCHFLIMSLKLDFSFIVFWIVIVCQYRSYKLACAFSQADVVLTMHSL